jgi:hypothetical protein
MSRGAAFVRFGTCLLALVMLISFPALRSHDFTAHFRVSEVARFVKRHTFVSPMHGETKLRLTISAIEPVPAIRTLPQSLKSHFETEVATRSSIVETLHRLKLGPHTDSDPEPIV